MKQRFRFQSLVRTALCLATILPTAQPGNAKVHADSAKNPGTVANRPTPQEGRKALLRAQELESLGEYEEALVQLDKAIAASPTNAELYGYRGRCFVNTHEYDKAIKDFSTMIKLNPKSVGNPYLHRGRCYQKLNDHQKAVADFTKGIEKEETGAKKQGKFFSLYMARGRSYELLGESNKALSDYRRCLEFKGGTADGGTVRMWKEKLEAKTKMKTPSKNF